MKLKSHREVKDGHRARRSRKKGVHSQDRGRNKAQWHRKKLKIHYSGLCVGGTERKRPFSRGVGHKGACEAPSRLAWKTGEIPIILQWNPLSAHPQSQVWLALSGLELIQNQLPSHLDVGALISGPEGSRGVEWRMASSDSRGVGWRVAPRGSRSQTKR